MGQKIEIKPNDQSWVGKKIKYIGHHKDTLIFEILFVGKQAIFTRDQYGVEGMCFLKIEGELYEEPGSNDNIKELIEVANIINKPIEEQIEKQKKINKEFFLGAQITPAKEPEEKYEKITDEFQTKILNKFEKFVDGEHQGHHCSGKCTKLGDKDFNVEKDGITYNFKINSEKKECEHDFESGWDFDSNKEIKCRKCRPKKEPDPFWLKVGDVIKRKLDSSSYGGVLKVLNIVDGKIQVKAFFDPDLDAVQWFSFEEFERDIGKESDFKKIKLVSPALFNYGTLSWTMTEYLFEEKFDAENYIKEKESHNAKIIWPAKDQFGRSIFYEVE